MQTCLAFFKNPSSVWSSWTKSAILAWCARCTNSPRSPVRYDFDEKRNTSFFISHADSVCRASTLSASATCSSLSIVCLANAAATSDLRCEGVHLVRGFKKTEIEIEEWIFCGEPESDPQSERRCMWRKEPNSLMKTCSLARFIVVRDFLDPLSHPSPHPHPISFPFT